MKYTPISQSKTGFSYVNETKVLETMEKLGFDLRVVVGKANKYWITGRTIDGKSYDLIDGPKYYKLVVNDRDFGIESGGDFNGWLFAGDIRKEIIKAKEGNDD